MNEIERIHLFIREQKEVLLNHSLYKEIRTIKDLQRFTEYHAYAVWDFMSLLKALQINLTCTSVPWFASRLPNTRYLINEIVLAEESDEYLDGRRLSHYEMYIDAMQAIGADVRGIGDFVIRIQQGGEIFDSIERSNLDLRIKDFLRFTFEIIKTGEAHKIASAFTFGREDLIPDMFTSILTEFQHSFPETDLSKLIYYFKRHIELDGDEHGPLAMQMIEELANDDPQKWNDIRLVAKTALQKRIALWDAIADAVAQ